MMPERRRSRDTICQVCAIPYRRGRDVALEFCLITSLIKRRWIFPKGIIESGETAIQAACKEVWEEAGLRGNVAPEPLGHFLDQKWGCELHVEVLLMEVTESHDVWPEMDQRQRCWVPADEAFRRLKRDELRSFLRLAEGRLREE